MESLLKIAIQAALEAGEEILKVYATDFDTEIKSDDSPLTLADKKSNTIITNYLRDTDIPIISEENIEIPYEDRKDWKKCWVVDPLDGTKEFIKRNGEFTVNIALVEDGKPVLGVVFVPVQHALYFGDAKAQKAFKIVVDNGMSIETILAQAKPIKKNTEDASDIKIVASRSHLNEATQNFIDSLDTAKEITIVSRGSSLKFCLIAEGEADIYPRFAPTMEWDSAAPHAICNAVGVKVTSLETEKELEYNKENLLNPWFICK